MRIELPTRIRLQYTAIALGVLFAVQQFQHTGVTFSVLFVTFIFLGNVAFNIGGGFSRVTGAYVFLFAMLTCGIGVVLKAFVGEAADSNLLVPNLLMAAYAGSMFVLLCVVVLTAKFSGRSVGIATTDGVDRLDYTLAALGCLAVGLLLQALNVFGGFPRDILSVLNQLNQTLPLAIILGTIGAIRDSGGRRSINFVSGAAMAFVLFLGVTGFSKQAMLTPVGCYVLGVWYARFNLRLIHILSLVVVAVLSFTVVPLIGGGRNAVPEGGATYPARLAIAWNVLTHLSEAREAVKEDEEYLKDTSYNTPYYNTSQGFIERLTIVPVDDTFFNYSDKGNYIGLRPIREAYINLIPHFLYPDKPASINGNFYAHEIGGFLAPDDFSTGISFSPVAEAYNVGGWIGIFFLLPAVWTSLFLPLDYICGDTRRSPWGLLMILAFAHLAAESLLGGLIAVSFYGNLSLLIAIFFCTRVAPVIGVLFYGRSAVAAPSNLVPARR